MKLFCGIAAALLMTSAAANVTTRANESLACQPEQEPSEVSEPTEYGVTSFASRCIGPTFEACLLGIPPSPGSGNNSSSQCDGRRFSTHPTFYVDYEDAGEASARGEPFDKDWLIFLRSILNDEDDQWEKRCAHRAQAMTYAMRHCSKRCSSFWLENDQNQGFPPSTLLELGCVCHGFDHQRFFQLPRRNPTLEVTTGRVVPAFGIPSTKNYLLRLLSAIIIIGLFSVFSVKLIVLSNDIAAEFVEQLEEKLKQLREEKQRRRPRASLRKIRRRNRV